MKTINPILKEVRTNEIVGGLAVNRYQIIVDANQKAHQVLGFTKENGYPTNYLQGKSWRTAIRSPSSKNQQELSNLIFKFLELESPVVFNYHTKRNKGFNFIKVLGATNNTLRLGLFWIIDPGKAKWDLTIGCFFFVNDDTEDNSIVIEKGIGFHKLQVKLKERAESRRLDYKFKQSVRQLKETWKFYALTLLTIFGLTTNYVGLLIGGLSGSKFSEHAVPYYDKIHEKIVPSEARKKPPSLPSGIKKSTEDREVSSPLGEAQGLSPDR